MGQAGLVAGSAEVAEHLKSRMCVPAEPEWLRSAWHTAATECEMGCAQVRPLDWPGVEPDHQIPMRLPRLGWQCKCPSSCFSA